MSTSTKSRKRIRVSTKSAGKISAKAAAPPAAPAPKPASRKSKNTEQRDAATADAKNVGANQVERVAKGPRVGAHVLRPTPPPPPLIALESPAAPKNAQVTSSAERQPLPDGAAQTEGASLAAAATTTTTTSAPPLVLPPKATPTTARERKKVEAAERRAERQRAKEATAAKKTEKREAKRAASRAAGGGGGGGGGATRKRRTTATAASSRSRKVADAAPVDGDNDGGGGGGEAGAGDQDASEPKRKAAGGGRAKSGATAAAATTTTRPKREPMRVSNRHELVRLLLDAIRQPGLAVVADTDAGSVRLDGEEDADTCGGSDDDDDDEDDSAEDAGIERERDDRSAAEILQDRLDRYYELRLLDIAAAARTRPRPAGKSIGATVSLADVLSVATTDDGSAADETDAGGPLAAATKRQADAKSREEKNGSVRVRQGSDGEEEKEAAAATTEKDKDDACTAAATKFVALRKKREKAPTRETRPKKAAKTTATAATAAAAAVEAPPTSIVPVVSAHLEGDLSNVAEWCIQVESLVYRTSETRSEHVCRIQSLVLAVTLQGRVPRSSMRAALFEHDYCAPLIPTGGGDGRNADDGSNNGSGGAAAALVPGPRWKPARGERLTRAQTVRAFRECTFEELCEWLDIDQPDDTLCPGCGLMCGRVASIKQTRGLDEGHTVLHKCTACDHRWKS